MRLELDFEKGVEENAGLYFEKAKKAKRKLAGLERAIEETKKALAKAKKGAKEKQAAPVKKKKREWFQAFHWFFSSDGFLVLAGRDAKSNEQLVKKQLDREDFFLHADIPGGAATIIKTRGKKVPAQTFREAAQFAAVRSKAWKQMLPSIDVYAVKAEQVSKQAPSRTSLPTGAFMIYGKRKWFRKTPLQFAVGLSKEDETTVISGPLAVIKKNASCFVELQQGNESAGSAAKKVISMLQSCSKKAFSITLDEIIQMIPSGNLRVKERD